MSGQSSSGRKALALKRRIDKGQCPGVDFIHLNVRLESLLIGPMFSGG